MSGWAGQFRGRTVLVGLLMMLAMLSAPAGAQNNSAAAAATKQEPTGTTAVGAQGAMGSVEPPRAIRRDGGRTGASDAGQAVSTPAAGSSGGVLEFLRVIFALAIVLGLILLMRWAGRRFFGATAAAGVSRQVKLLSRTPLGPRQQVLLLQVGVRRIIVAGDSAGQLSTLANIDDPDEIAQLLAASGASSASRNEEETEPTDVGLTPPARTFETALNREQGKFGAEDAGIDAPGAGELDPAVQSARGEVGSLIEKVKLLSQQLKRG